MGHHARLKENEHLFRYRAYLEGNFFRCVRARANLRALMTQKSCAVEMRNAILRNHLKSLDTLAGGSPYHSHNSSFFFRHVYKAARLPGEAGLPWQVD